MASAAGSVAQANAQQKQANANAAEVERVAQVNYGRDLRDIRYQHGTTRAQTAANGLQMTGSAVDVMRSNDMHMMADAQENLYSAKHEASQMRKAGRAQRQQGYLSAGASLFSTGASIFSSQSGQSAMSLFGGGSSFSSPILSRYHPQSRKSGFQAMTRGIY